MTINRRILAALLAIIMCLGMLVSCKGGEDGVPAKKQTVDSVKSDPYEAIKTSGDILAKSLDAKYGDIFAVFDKASEGVLTYSAEAKVPEMGDVTVSASVDGKTGAYSAKAGASVMGMQADASVWGDKNNIAVSVPLLLGEDAYGIKFDTLLDDLSKSELVGNVTGGMSFDDLMASLEEESGVTMDTVKGVLDIEKWKTAFDKYTADVEAIQKAKTYNVAEETYKLGDEDIAVISVETTVGKDDIEKTSGAAVAMIESVMGELLKAAGVDMNELMDEASGEMGLEELEELGEIKVKDYINKKTGALVAVDVTVGEMGTVTVTLGEDISKKLDITITGKLVENGMTADIAATVKEVTEEGKGGFTVDLKASSDGEELGVMALSFVRTKADGKFELKGAVDGEELLKVTGTLIYSADEFTLGVDSISADGEDIDIGVTVSVKAGGTVEAIPEYVNILGASAEDLSGIMSILGSLTDSLGGTAEDDYYDDYDYDDYEDYDYDYEDLYEEY